MKTCKDCGQPKELSEFYVNTRMVGGHYNDCKLCYRIKRGQNPDAPQRARPRSPIVHGANGYWRGCRCDECRAGNREYNQKQYQSQKFAIDEDDTNLPPVVEIRPYQPKLKMEDFPKPDSLFEVLKGLYRQPGRRSSWKAA